MCRLSVPRRLVVLPILLIGAVAPVSAQLSKVEIRTHAGAAIPVGNAADYFDVGWSGRVDAVHPMNERFNLVLDVGLNHLKHHGYTYVPDSNLLRYQLQVETDLLNGSDRFHVTPYVGAGAMTFRSAELTRGMESQRIEQTHVAGTAGLRLGASSQDGPTWWLSGELNWSPFSEENARALQTSAKWTTPPELSSLQMATVTLGMSLPF